MVVGKREIPKCIEVGRKGEGDTQIYGGGEKGGGGWEIPKCMEVGGEGEGDTQIYGSGGEGCEEAWRDEVSKGRDAPPPTPHRFKPACRLSSPRAGALHSGCIGVR